MREENVARARAFTEWLAGGREDAFRAKAEILEQPPAEWDAWLAAHPEAATMHTLQAQQMRRAGFTRRMMDAGPSVLCSS